MVEPIVNGIIEAPDERRRTTDAKTLVFTCAQSNTLIHEGFFGALTGYAKQRNAELHISRFTYNKASHGKKSVKPGTKTATDDQALWYDPRIEPYVSDESIQITDDLVWCGELNIIPTRVFPLSSLKTYTRQCSGIVPHVKMHMESVPTMKHSPTKFMYTTGAVTQRNYIQKVAGQVADFHHVFGALVVEIGEDGTWWARQINADKTGAFYDLNTRYEPFTGEATPIKRVAAVTHGDIHVGKADLDVLEAVFGYNGIVDQLHPRVQFFHDLVDFTPRNHHNISDPHFRHKQWLNGFELVRTEFLQAASLLQNAARTDTELVVVMSNHDIAINQWLRNPDAIRDPANAEDWHWLNWEMHKRRRHGEDDCAFKFLLSDSLWAHGEDAGKISVVAEDDSYLLLGEIECGLHGHLGPNGARGNPKNLRTVGKANTGHTHSAGIVEGVYTAGVYGKLDMGYNRGLSSWSHSLIVTYPNAKRAILTIKGGRAWR